MKSMKSLVTKKRIFLFVFLIIVIGKADVAYAADNTFCHKYAKTAVEQYMKAKANNCRGLAYPKWSDDYNHHFQWCMRVSQAQAESEQKAREQFILNCISGEYAKTAVEQYMKAKANNCQGLAYPRWSDDYNHHFQWRRRVSQAQAELEQNAREEFLLNCMCHKYAKTAVEQYMKAKANNCAGLAYPRWSDDYNHHFQWRRRVSPAQAESEQKAREDFLRKCK